MHLSSAAVPQKPPFPAGIFPFTSGEEAWFWFIQAQDARIDGARFSAGLGLYPRRVKEGRAHKLWIEAIERLECVLELKGIVKKTLWSAAE